MSAMGPGRVKTPCPSEWGQVLMRTGFPVYLRPRGFDFLSEVKRGIGHWYAERRASDRDYLGPDPVVEITVTPR